MSKPAQKRKLPKKHAIPQKRESALIAALQRKNKLLVIAIIAIAAAIPFGLGKYFEFNSPGPFDSGAYVYSAKHIIDGAEIGVEEKPSAQLGTLLVNMLGVWLFGFSETGPKLIQTILQAAALVLMFIALRKLFGTIPAAVSVIVASSYLSAPLIAKFGNVKEQYMIAFMVMAISCFVLRQLGGRWWWAVLTGAFMSWAPLFKPTGISAIGAIGLFVVIQPLLKNRTWKQTGVDILLLFAGTIAGIGPLYMWIIVWDVKLGLPYSFVWMTLAKFLPAAPDPAQPKPTGGYISQARKLVTFSQQWPIVLRYYSLLILPIALALGAIITRIVRLIHRALSTEKENKRNYDRFVFLFAVWWLLDMAFIWISPRSYEQYYLPLNASAAMLGGYLIATYSKLLENPVNKNIWRFVALLGLLVMIATSWHIFFGIEKSPHSGTPYGEKRRGYAQKLSEIKRIRRDNLKGPWEVVGQYIRLHSSPQDKMYVWGWFPGIYVQARRFSPSPYAVMMPRPTPQRLKEMINNLLDDFEKERPKFIVDSRKRHVPMERPPYELWPIVPKDFIGMKKTGFLPLNKTVIEAYDKAWSDLLRKTFDEDEALRFEVLKPFRDFVMNNYRIVRMFGQHVLFELNTPPAN
jgi:4-amino-4-deoxy-L-arabinose transferase-like glycosyltransferase